MNVDLNYIVAATMICGTLFTIGWKLGHIGIGILDRISGLEKKVDVLISDMRNSDHRCTRIENRLERLESRIERLEQGATP